MKKKSINLFAISVAMIVLASISISTSAFGQEKFSVSGEIVFYEEQGEFRVGLRTFEEFGAIDQQAGPGRGLVIEPTSQQLKAKRVPFNFVDVPAGTYCIVCLHDLNKSGKMDKIPETGFPLEPYGFSGELSFGMAMWEQVSFKVDKNLSGIEIMLERVD